MLRGPRRRRRVLCRSPSGELRAGEKAGVRRRRSRTLNDAARKRVANAASFASLTPQQQDETLRSIETTDDFGVLRTITVAGYFSHPSHRGNRDAAGWKAIGFEDRMSWTPPFGYYDRPEIMARLLPGRRA